MTIEIHATVCGGFPVLVTAAIDGADPSVGIFHAYAIDIEIFTMAGKPAPFIERKMTARDYSDLNEQIMEEWAEQAREAHAYRHDY